MRNGHGAASVSMRPGHGGRPVRVLSIVNPDLGEGGCPFVFPFRINESWFSCRHISL